MYSLYVFMQCVIAAYASELATDLWIFVLDFSACILFSLNNVTHDFRYLQSIKHRTYVSQSMHMEFKLQIEMYELIDNGKEC